ncbi:MAG TPA: serine hydrolase [Patescibacteria group bacterium]|nr:serine hydrolase [Patescibacteria group bacterium]
MEEHKPAEEQKTGVTQIPRRKLLVILAATAALLSVAYASYQLYRHYVISNTERFILQKRQIAWQKLVKDIQQQVGAFKGEVGLEIEDLRTGWKLKIHEDTPFPSASLVKIPIMATCFDDYSRGMLDLTKTLVLRNRLKAGGSGKLKDLPAGTRVRIDTLNQLMVTESDNTAANTLIDFFGFDYLNRSFQRLGLKHTNIVRLMMDFKSRDKGMENFTTASDMAFFLRRIYSGEFLSQEISGQCLDILKQQKMRDRIPKRLPPDTVVAHKTGLENGVCHDVGIVFTSGGDFLICVLTKHNEKTSLLAKKLIIDISKSLYDYCLLY